VAAATASVHYKDHNRIEWTCSTPRSGLPICQHRCQPSLQPSSQQPVGHSQQQEGSDARANTQDDRTYEQVACTYSVLYPCPTATGR